MVESVENGCRRLKSRVPLVYKGRSFIRHVLKGVRLSCFGKTLHEKKSGILWNIAVLSINMKLKSVDYSWLIDERCRLSLLKVYDKVVLSTFYPQVCSHSYPQVGITVGRHTHSQPFPTPFNFSIHLWQLFSTPLQLWPTLLSFSSNFPHRKY